MNTLKPLIISLFLISISSITKAQQTVSVRINSSFDDLEEWIAGPPTQSKTVGEIDWNSSDLEFGYESSNKDPQLLGLRFTALNIPKGSLITKAYIQFTVDAIAKNADPCGISIRIEPSDNASKLDSNKFHLTNRMKSSDSVLWTVSGSTWGTVGSATSDQRTADFSKLIQAIVDREGWATGNAVALFLKGTGTREVESFDGDAPKAPLLVVEFIPPVVLSVRINSSFDDLEEWVAGPPTQSKIVGEIDWNSSDLEFGYESSTKDPQLVGLRFNGITIPQGSLVRSAHIQFNVDATAKNADPCNVILKYDPSDNASKLDSNKFHLTNRTKSADSVTWAVSGSTWGTVGSAGIDQRTPNLSGLLQNLVDRNGWTSGNSMAFFMYGTGTREVESFDGDAPKAPQLVISYIPMVTKSVRISSAFDDLEEWIAGPPTQNKPLGEIDWNSSDLEFGYESSTVDPQMIGLRFQNVDVPNGAIVKNSYIQFTVDATTKNADPCVVNIKFDPSDNAAKLDSNKFHLTNRAKSADSIIWTVSDKSNWSTVGAAGANQRTADITPLIKQIIERNGWAKGNAMAFFIKGTGTREVESFDGDAPKAPMLVVNYLGELGSQTAYTPNPVTNFPLMRGSKWNFWDKGFKPNNKWMDTLNNDTPWAYGNAPLGYGDAHMATTVGFGGNASSKHITTWFRKTINVPSVAALSDTLELNTMYDDGIAVYINGTEIKRINLPTGTLDSNTVSSSNIDGLKETVYYTWDIPKTLLRNGKNVIAVEIHQSSGNSSDIGFDLELMNRSMRINPPKSTCMGASDAFISCFESILPTDHTDSLNIPSTHNFQRIFVAGQAYTTSGGNAGTNFDFTGFVPKNGSSTQGWVAINHETNPGGVSLLDVQFNCNTGLWVVDSSRKIDFSGVVLTAANCSGGVTPWSTSVTCEETRSSSDVNSDGYVDLGWMVEIDPVTKKIKQYGTGKAQKLWAMGCMNHENVCFKNDSLTAYYGEDVPNGNVWKFVANSKTNLSAGKLFVLKLDSAVVGNEPKGTTGKWLQIANSTPTECNNVKNAAITAGGTAFNGVEDVEINPIDGAIFFTAKGMNRTYKFADNGNTISGFQTYVGGKSYRITTSGGNVSEDWGGGNDNLTFDSRGNLYVLQDGGRDHIWVVKNGHTQTNPKVEIFMTTPLGSEPTGMTFTPNEKFMFLSIQEPANGTTVQKDASGASVVFNKSTTLVIARDEAFTPGAKATFTVNDSTQCLNGNSFSFNNTASGTSSSWNFGNGTSSTSKNPLINYTTSSSPAVTLTTTDNDNGCKSTKVANMKVFPKPTNVLVISGNTSAANGSIQNYSATSVAGSSYSWTITNGTPTSSTNSNTITIFWGTGGTSGSVQVREIDANGCQGDETTLNVSLAVSGIETINEINGLKVYPNPVNSILKLESEVDISYVLTDLTGTTLLSGHKNIDVIEEIDLSNLASGAYFITIKDSKVNVTIRIVKN